MAYEDKPNVNYPVEKAMMAAGEFFSSIIRFLKLNKKTLHPVQNASVA